MNAEENTVSDSREYVSDKGAALCKVVPKGTLLVSFKLTLGRLAFAGRDLFTNEAIAALTLLNEREMSKEFLFWFLQFFDWVKAAENDVKLKGMTLNKAKLKEIVVHFPNSLSEQQRIVGVLDEAFEGLATAKANAEKNLQNARALFESHLQSVFNNRGVGWVEKSLGELCIVDWGNTDLTKKSYVEGGSFLAVSAAGCDGRIGHKEHAKHTPVLSAIGAQCGRMFLPEEDFTAIKNTITLTPRDGKCTGKFLYRLLTHVELPKRGAAQPFISKGDIQAFQVVVPASLAVQQEIEESLQELETETQRLAAIYEQKLSALGALKKSLLHQAFSGEL